MKSLYLGVLPVELLVATVILLRERTTRLAARTVTRRRIGVARGFASMCRSYSRVPWLRFLDRRWNTGNVLISVEAQQAGN